MDELHAPLPDMSEVRLVDALHAGTDPAMAESIRQMLAQARDGSEPISAWSSHIE